MRIFFLRGRVGKTTIERREGKKRDSVKGENFSNSDKFRGGGKYSKMGGGGGGGRVGGGAGGRVGEQQKQAGNAGVGVQVRGREELGKKTAQGGDSHLLHRAIS